MRISADPKSPWFSSHAATARVYLDGVELRHCVSADDEGGTVECYAVDEHGYVVHDGEFARMITRRGRVAIIYAAMHFESWMRRRRAAAHAELMSRNCGIAY